MEQRQQEDLITDDQWRRTQRMKLTCPPSLRWSTTNQNFKWDCSNQTQTPDFWWCQAASKQLVLTKIKWVFPIDKFNKFNVSLELSLICPWSLQDCWHFCTEDEKSGTIIVWANWAKAHKEKEASRQFRLLNLWSDKWAGQPVRCYLRVDTPATVLPSAWRQRQKCWFFFFYSKDIM